MTLNFIRCYHAIKALLTTENVFYLKKSVSSYVVFYLKLLFLYDFNSLNTVSYSNLFVLYDLSNKMWSVENVVC